MARAIRDRNKAALWRRFVREQARGDLTVREFCRRHELREPSFYGWRRQLMQRPGAATFMPVHVQGRSTKDHDGGRESPPPNDNQAADTGGRIEIALRGGQRIRVRGRVDRQMLIDVLAVLEVSAC